MRRRIRHPLGAILYVATLTAAALTAHADPKPAVDPKAATQTPADRSPAGTPKATSEISPHARMAVKLAGLVAFVANSCPQLKPDYPRFKAAIAALGVGVDQLDQPTMKSAYLGYTSQYQTDVKGNCEKAREQFGPGGKAVPDIFAVK